MRYRGSFWLSKSIVSQKNHLNRTAQFNRIFWFVSKWNVWKSEPHEVGVKGAFISFIHSAWLCCHVSLFLVGKGVYFVLFVSSCSWGRDYTIILGVRSVGRARKFASENAHRGGRFPLCSYRAHAPDFYVCRFWDKLKLHRGAPFLTPYQSFACISVQPTHCLLPVYKKKTTIRTPDVFQILI